jgi:TolA-binding protein
MREYVALLKASPGQEALVRNRLQAFVEQGEGVGASIDVLTTAVEQNPLTPAFRELLAWLYMSTDDYARAYDVYRALDRLQQQKGQRLFAFAQKAADADHFEVATTALEALLDRYPDAKVAPRARRALGDTYRQWAESKQPNGAAPDSTARYDAARAAYRTFLDRHPGHAAAPAVRSQLGTLQLDVYRDLDAAQSTLEQVVSSAPETTAAHEARYDLGRIALLRGDLERARLLFSRLAQRLRSGDLAEQARFELALLQFYRGRFDAARTQAKATSANPSADVTNDAIELRVLIQENTGPDSLNTPLRLYARARLALRRHAYAQAGARLDSLLQAHGRHSLADEARFRRAEVFLAQGDTSAAAEQYRTLPREHPRSPYADRSLFRLGTLYEQQNRAREAIQLYDRLLAEYPQSLLASDARTRLRTLRRTQS